MNPYIAYYNNQIGSGLAGFQGIRYQKGNGWFGRLFSSAILPFVKQLIPALGKRVLPTGVALANDILGGENVAKSMKTRLKETGKNMADETLDVLKTKLQKGSGIKRKRKLQVTDKKKKVNKKKTIVKRKTKSNFLK
jgi:hypothetical protein